MYRQPLINDVDISELNYLRASGMSNRDIAKRLDCSENTIGKYLPKVYKRHSEKERNEIAELYASGIKAKDIAKEYGMSVASVYCLVSKEGASRKPRKKEVIKEKKPEPAPVQQTEPASTTKLHSAGILYGNFGDYVVNTEKHILAAYPKPEGLTKDQLRDYINDLMAVWREM